jgi:acyl-CoA thioester hydrolase
MIEASDWPFQLSVAVVFRDIDAMGHVNNAVYFTYMETARTTFFINRLRLADPQDLPVIVAEATCTYLSPLRLGDTLQIHLGVSRIGRRSFDLSYRMSAGDDRLVARAKTAMVAYDYQLRAAIPIPVQLKTLLDASLVSNA